MPYQTAQSCFYSLYFAVINKFGWYLISNGNASFYGSIGDQPQARIETVRQFLARPLSACVWRNDVRKVNGLSFNTSSQVTNGYM